MVLPIFHVMVLSCFCIRGRAAFQRFASTDAKHYVFCISDTKKCISYSIHLGISAQSEIDGVHYLYSEQTKIVKQNLSVHKKVEMFSKYAIHKEFE